MKRTILPFRWFIASLLVGVVAFGVLIVSGVYLPGHIEVTSEVEVFGLTGHPRAKRAYTWSHRAGQADKDKRFVAVLEIPPVKDAQTAVQASIMADFRTARS